MWLGQDAFDNEQFAGAADGLAAGPQDAMSLIVFPIMQDRLEDQQIAPGDRFKRVPGGDNAAFGDPHAFQPGPGVSHNVRLVKDDTLQSRVGGENAAEQRALAARYTADR